MQPWSSDEAASASLAQKGAAQDASSLPRFDPEAAHPARVYNVWIGGKDAYGADRRAAAEVAACRPQVVVGARANRAFLSRAVRYLAGQRGIRQFLDIGPGLPAPGNTHEVAQAIAPQSKIVYVDNDRCKLGCSHARWAGQATPEANTEAEFRARDTLWGHPPGRLRSFGHVHGARWIRTLRDPTRVGAWREGRARAQADRPK
jgi:hypothetical protein